MMRRANINPFFIAIWGLTLLLAGYLCVWPLLENGIARYTWEQHPCHLEEGPIGRYFYVVGPTTYIRTRRNFWQLGGGEQQFSTNVWSGKANDTCWVNPRSPGDAVLTLAGLGAPEAPKAFILSGVIVLLGAFLSWFMRRRARQMTLRHRAAAIQDGQTPEVAASPPAGEDVL